MVEYSDLRDGNINRGADFVEYPLFLATHLPRIRQSPSPDQLRRKINIQSIFAYMTVDFRKIHNPDDLGAFHNGQARKYIIVIHAVQKVVVFRASNQCHIMSP
jgi:hypothetical protein